MGKGVATTHREYDRFNPQWQRCADVVDGQRAVHAGGECYLRKFANEDEKSYQRRKDDVEFYNATWRTISGLVGMAFRKDPTLKLPKPIEPFAKNIDLAGTSLTGLAKLLCEDVLEFGRVGLLVDHPPMPVNVTAMNMAVAEALGMRPMMKVYQAKCITNWRYARVGNATVLAMVVLKEEAEVQGDSEFEWTCEDHYRVLDLDDHGFYRQRVFRVKNDLQEQIGDDVYPIMRGAPMTYIPFSIIGVNGIQIACDEPPLIDLVDQNVKHYKVSALLDNAQYFAGAPTMVLAGFIPDKPGDDIYVGGDRAIILPDPNASVSYVELKGDSVPSLERRIAAIERRMASLGAQMLVESLGREKTATEAAINASGENSILAAIVIAVSDVIERALTVMAEWVGASGEIVYQISREFLPVAMDAQKLTAMVAAWQAGAISEAELFDNLKRGDVIDGEKTLEAHQEEVGTTQALPAPIPAGAANDQQVAA